MDQLSPVRAREILQRARGARILVVGDLMLDRYLSGTVERISPEAPVPVVQVRDESAAVGGAGNVAANLAALGASCWVVGCVGRDPAGAELRTALEALGVHTDGLVEAPDRPTSVKTRIMSRRQQVARVDREDDSDASAPLAAALEEAVTSLTGPWDAVVLEDYNKGVLVPSVIGAALEASGGAPTVVDPKRRNFFSFTGATVFKPNAKELADALGTFVHPDDPAWMEETRERLGCSSLLLTLGEEGMALQSHGTPLVRIPTVARAVYDVSGAGDTVTAVTAAALATGAATDEAAILANHAAAVEVGKAGVATVTPAEILRHADEHQELCKTTGEPP